MESSAHPSEAPSLSSLGAPGHCHQGTSTSQAQSLPHGHTLAATLTSAPSQSTTLLLGWGVRPSVTRSRHLAPLFRQPKGTWGLALRGWTGFLGPQWALPRESCFSCLGMVAWENHLPRPCEHATVRAPPFCTRPAPAKHRTNEEQVRNRERLSPWCWPTRAAMVAEAHTRWEPPQDQGLLPGVSD